MLTEKEEDLIEDLWKENKSLTYIAEQADVSIPEVRKYIKKLEDKSKTKTEEKKTAYGELRDKYHNLRFYESGFSAFRDGKHVQELPNILFSMLFEDLEHAKKETANKDELSDKELEKIEKDVSDIVYPIIKKNDSREIYKVLDEGIKRTRERFGNRFGNRDLDYIIDSTPRESLETSLRLYEPEGEKYAKTSELHRKVYNAMRNLGAYQNRETSEEVKVKALEKMTERIYNYYETEYKEDEDLVDLLKILASANQEIVLRKTMRFLKEDTEELDKRLEGRNLNRYVKASLSEEKAPRVYENLLNMEYQKAVQEAREQYAQAG